VPLLTPVRVAGYCHSPKRERQRPIIRSITHAPDQTVVQLRFLHYCFDLAASKPLLFCLLLTIFMKFRGPKALV
jgi:hypothetical protein